MGPKDLRKWLLKFEAAASWSSFISARARSL